MALSETTARRAPSADELAALETHLRPLADIPDEEWAFFSGGLETRRLAVGEHLVRQGVVPDGVGFLVHGLLRIARVEGRREVTLGFDCEDRLVGAYDAWLTRSPAQYSIDALEESVLVFLPGAWLEAVLRRHPSWQELARRIAERELLHKVDKELRIRTRTPEERYADLLRSGSYLVRRVPQYLLASYLGVRPETLSRIRARMP